MKKVTLTIDILISVGLLAAALLSYFLNDEPVSALLYFFGWGIWTVGFLLDRTR